MKRVDFVNFSPVFNLFADADWLTLVLTCMCFLMKNIWLLAKKPGKLDKVSCADIYFLILLVCFVLHDHRSELLNCHACLSQISLLSCYQYTWNLMFQNFRKQRTVTFSYVTEILNEWPLSRKLCNFYSCAVVTSCYCYWSDKKRQTCIKLYIFVMKRFCGIFFKFRLIKLTEVLV